ncbi:uncharacterized protein LOC120296736 isoform X2 [Crotalus tigris]|uniref:uncharacterized protein LOC120296736 isoform X2 n=1 Tax=Crotalus tigris TaxID=88082 RepID=UPI00192F6F2A|nr:uncharacterized protein LOC120296736 isoform X2 [Crotalus tigris]
MGFLNIYIQKADTLNAQTLLMRTREKRLNDAIKLLAGDQGQHCKPCGDYTWLQRAEGCYRWTDGLMPWRTCEDECQRQGGRLVKADTEGEMSLPDQEVNSTPTFLYVNGWTLPRNSCSESPTNGSSWLTTATSCRGPGSVCSSTCLGGPGTGQTEASCTSGCLYS